MNLSLDLTNLNHPRFDPDIKASLPCQPKPTLEPSNPKWLTPRAWQNGGNVAEQKVATFWRRLFLGQKIASPRSVHRDSTTGLSKSIMETHNKEGICDEARPSLWDVFNSWRVGWVSGTYRRFINFSGDTIENLYVYVPSRKKGQPTRMLCLLAAFLRGFCHANQLLLHHFLRCCRSCYLVTWLILNLLLGLAGWPALFKKWAFLTLNSGLQSTCLTDRLLREMDPIWTACRLRSSQRIGQFYTNSGKWKLVFSHKYLVLEESTSTPAINPSVQLLSDGSNWTGIPRIWRNQTVANNWSFTPCNRRLTFCDSDFTRLLPSWWVNQTTAGSSPLGFPKKKGRRWLAGYFLGGVDFGGVRYLGFPRFCRWWVFTRPSWRSRELWWRTNTKAFWWSWKTKAVWWSVYTVFTGFWSRIFESKANLLSKSSVARQGDSMAKVTSRPFTYLEPSILARSSGAAFNIIE